MAVFLKMTQKDLLDIGAFSEAELLLFEQYTTQKTVGKNECLLKEGQVCGSVFYVLSGAFYQFQTDGITNNMIDLHLPNEWVFNHQSLVGQLPSTTAIRAFTQSQVIELSLGNLHQLIAKSPAFLQFGKVLSQPNHRLHLFDHSLTPTQKYQYITAAKPLLTQTFPIKMIASYLKIAPETLSRVRASY